MQRYRVNYILLASLVIGFFVSGGAAYGLWKFQVNRNATRLLDKANSAEAEGDVAEAFTSLAQYVRLRKEETDAWGRLGEVSAKVVEDDKLDLDTRRSGFKILQDAVGATNDAKLRRKLAELQVMTGIPDLALVNINQLLEDGKGDAELKGLKAQCLFLVQRQAEGATWCNRLIGYDPKSDAFDVAKAEAPDQPAAYALLAGYLHNNRQPELAKRVIDQLSTANPKSREAYMIKYQFLRQTGDNEGSLAALDKAYELEPEDASVISAMGVEAITRFQKGFAEAQASGDKAQIEENKKHLSEAGKFFAQGLEKYPERIDFYERAALVETLLDKPAEALATVERGLKKFPLKATLDDTGMPRSIRLSNQKVEILMQQKDFKAIDAEIKALRGMQNSRVAALADFHEARLNAVNEKWQTAASALQSVKGRLLGFPDQQALASAIQGFCYTQLGQLDLALEAYKWALDRNPNQPQALMGRMEIESRLGLANQDEHALELDKLVQEMISKPKDQQDWTAVTQKLDSYIEEQAKLRPTADNWVKSRKALLRGQMFGMRAAATTDEADQKQLFQEARKAITEAYTLDKDDPTILQHAIRLMAQEPNGGPQSALKVLDARVAKGADTAAFRALRIDLLFAIHGPEVAKEIEAATQNMEAFPPAQQASVWTTAAARFEQLGRIADSLRCLEKAADLSPNSLPTRTAMFDLALKQADDAGMRKAQQRILEIVKDEADPAYVLTEVRRRIIGQQTGASTKEELAEARPMLETAIKRRDSWSELYVTSAQLYMTLENDVDKALAVLGQAMERGGTSLNAVAMQVRLFAQRNRMKEAREAMDRLPAPNWSAILERYAADVLLAVGETDKAFVEAEKFAKSRPQDDKTQSWFGNIARQANKPEAAEAALKKAVEINPADPDNWTQLVTFYLQAKRAADVERTFREAHLALDDEYLPLLTGKYYELQSRWQEAEDIYLSAFADRMDEIPVARRMAEFYLMWVKSNPENRGKAAKYLNRILRASYEGKLPPTDPTAAWGRRQAAQQLATSGDYQDSLKAERMLNETIQSGAASLEDREQLVDVLSLRDDPGSRERAVAMLRQMKQERGLPPERELHLGHALFDLGEWDAAKAQMQEAIGRYPQYAGLQTAYISMLIQRKELEEARLRISRLETLKDAAAGAGQLRLDLAAASGNKQEVRNVLTKMTPDLRVVTQQQLEFLANLSQLADKVGDYEYALKLMTEYARRVPGSELAMARLTALHGDLQQGMNMLKQLFDSDIDNTLSVALEVLRARRSEAPQMLGEEVDTMIRKALRDDPESARRLVMEAEALEIQEKFEEAIAAYARVLARDDVPKPIRAMAANNMAFLVALKSQKPEDLDLALKAVNEAVQSLGPSSDILDTRALVYLARGQNAEAVADMKLAVKMKLTPSKSYHLAQALFAAGDLEGAVAAWQRAKADGLGPDKVSQLELEKLEQFTRQIESVRIPVKR